VEPSGLQLRCIILSAKRHGVGVTGIRFERACFCRAIWPTLQLETLGQKMVKGY